jgi:threonylcarbamoyladenosine tRNA methylthiotransferase MtaB
LLESRQTGHQRAFLKIQDGCDAYCTYCIIPTLRPRVSSKPVEDVVEEARRLVGAGHVELILTGIFMGAYGQETALRRRQIARDALTPLGRLIEGLCTRVPGLKRLRLSSLEPGDLTADLLGLMRSHAQVVPHFHLPLQSGSERVLRRMNRQYTRDDFLRMIDDVRAAFDRPAITTDIIVGFPGETEDEFRQTVDVAERSGFIHVHAFPFSPRPGTAAARWAKDFVRPDVAAERVRALREIGERQGLSFRRQFAGETVEVLAESSNASDDAHWQHGRTARYFAVHFQHPEGAAGRTVRVRVDEVLPDRTVGTVVGMGEA